MKQFGKKIGIGFFWVGIWQLLYWLVNRDILVVAPLSVAKNLIQLGSEQSFYLTLAHSLGTILSAFLVALLTGNLLAILAYRQPLFRDLLYPLVGVMKATPVASFIILALVFLHTESVPWLISFLMVMPLVWQNMLEALLAVDEQLLEMAAVFRVPFIQQFKHIYVPAVLPSFLASWKTGFGYAWKSSVTAEAMTAPQQTIGKHIVDAKIYLDTLTLFTWTVVVIILSIFTEKLLLFCLNSLVKHYYPGLTKETKK